MRLLSLLMLLLLVLIFCLIVRGGRGRAQQAAARTVPLYAAGVIQISNAMVGRHTFATPIPLNSGCFAGPQTDIARLKSLGWTVSHNTTTVTVTLSAPGTGTFWFLCLAGTN